MFSVSEYEPRPLFRKENNVPQFALSLRIFKDSQKAPFNKIIIFIFKYVHDLTNLKSSYHCCFPSKNQKRRKDKNLILRRTS